MTTEQIEGFPPFAADGEPPVQDHAFFEECLVEARIMAARTHWKLSQPVLTRNAKFGPVWRSDFRIPVGGEAGEYDDSVNRIMLWRLPNGGLGKFFGSNLHLSPLKAKAR